MLDIQEIVGTAVEAIGFDEDWAVINNGHVVVVYQPQGDDMVMIQQTGDTDGTALIKIGDGGSYEREGELTELAYTALAETK